MIKSHVHRFILLLLLLITICIVSIILYNKPERFLTDTKPIEKTKLWGSLFSDNLPLQIITLTDPPILYDNKRIELIKYSDVLL